jgi:hypothetical protein
MVRIFIGATNFLGVTHLRILVLSGLFKGYAFHEFEI